MFDLWPMAALRAAGVSLADGVEPPEFSARAFVKLNDAVGQCLTLFQSEEAMEAFGDLDEEASLAWLEANIANYALIVAQVRHKFTVELVGLAVDGVVDGTRWPEPPVTGNTAQVLWWRGVGEGPKMLNQVAEAIVDRAVAQAEAQVDEEESEVISAVARGELPPAALGEYREQRRHRLHEATLAHAGALVDRACPPREGLEA